ncbi:hypothetical protein Tco_0462611 [Tanacetum coccineum]
MINEDARQCRSSVRGANLGMALLAFSGYGVSGDMNALLVRLLPGFHEVQPLYFKESGALTLWNSQVLMWSNTTTFQELALTVVRMFPEVQIIIERVGKCQTINNRRASDGLETILVLSVELRDTSKKICPRLKNNKGTLGNQAWENVRAPAKVLEGLPPIDNVGFQNDLVPGCAPVALGALLDWRLPKCRSYMSNEGVSDKGFIRPSPRRGESGLLFVKKKDGSFWNVSPIEVRTSKEHKEHLKLILELLKKEVLYAKFPKCEFWIPNVQFLCYVIDSKGIHDGIQTKIESIKDWTISKSTQQRFVNSEGLARILSGGSLKVHQSLHSEGEAKIFIAICDVRRRVWALSRAETSMAYQAYDTIWGFVDPSHKSADIPPMREGRFPLDLLARLIKWWSLRLGIPSQSFAIVTPRFNPNF